MSAVDLDGESADNDEPQGDGTEPDGSQLLLDAEVIRPDSGALISLPLNTPSPAERDSMLLLDSELYLSGKSITMSAQIYISVSKPCLPLRIEHVHSVHEVNSCTVKVFFVY